MNIELIATKDLPDNILQDICKLKQQHWKYSIPEQMKWIKRNLTQDDIHVLLYNTPHCMNDILA
jgi:hypothetical protein